MKNAKKVLCAIIVILLIIGAVILISRNKKSKNYIQNVSVENNELEDTIINDIELSKGKIEKNGDIYYITMTATNNTKDVIDMSNYRISFRDKNAEEIEWFRGTIIGEVLPGESMDLVVESYADLSELDTLYYEDYFKNK